MREVRVLTIGLDAQDDAPVLLQCTAVGRRVLPVWVGYPEAAAIEVEH